MSPRGEEGPRNSFYGVAQLAEHQNLDLMVVGSIPTSVANY